MVYSATALRKDIYSVLDQALETGIPVEIERNGQRLRIIPETEQSRLDRLEAHDILVGSSEGLEDIHWNDFWNPEDN